MRKTILAASGDPIHRQIDIQNMLRHIGVLLKKRTLQIEGDLCYLNEKFVGRTQELAETLFKEQH